MQEKEQKVERLNKKLTRYGLEAANYGIRQAIFDETEPGSETCELNKRQFNGKMKAETVTQNEISNLIDNISKIRMRVEMALDESWSLKPRKVEPLRQVRKLKPLNQVKVTAFRN